MWNLTNDLSPVLVRQRGVRSKRSRILPNNLRLFSTNSLVIKPGRGREEPEEEPPLPYEGREAGGKGVAPSSVLEEEESLLEEEDEEEDWGAE